MTYEVQPWQMTFVARAMDGRRYVLREERGPDHFDRMLALFGMTLDGTGNFHTFTPSPGPAATITFRQWRRERLKGQRARGHHRPHRRS